MCFWNVDSKSPAQTQLTELSSPVSLEGNLVKDCKSWLSSVICIYGHQWGFETHCTRHCTNMRQLLPLAASQAVLNGVQQSTSQIFEKSRRWKRYQGAIWVFVNRRPAVFIAKWFRIFLIIMNWGIRKIPWIIICQSNPDVIRGRGGKYKTLPQRTTELHMQIATFITSHIF